MNLCFQEKSKHHFRDFEDFFLSRNVLKLITYCGKFCFVAHIFSAQKELMRSEFNTIYVTDPRPMRNPLEKCIFKYVRILDFLKCLSGSVPGVFVSCYQSGSAMSKPLCGVLRAVKTPCSWAGCSPRVRGAIPVAKLISVPLPVQAQQRCAVLLLDQQLALRCGGHQPLGGHQEEAVSVFPAVPVGLCTSQYYSHHTGIVKPVWVLQPRQCCLNGKAE